MINVRTSYAHARSRSTIDFIARDKRENRSRSRMRMRGLGLILGLFLLSGGVISGGSTPKKGKFVPPDGKVLLIIGQDVTNIHAYVRATEEIPAGFTVYTSAEFADGLKTRMDQGGGLQHAQKIVDKYPNTVLQIGLWMVDTEEQILEGMVDESLDRLADWIKSTKRPVYLRIGYEFDYPKNHYDPKDYVLAYRSIVDRFREQEVENVAYVWHSYAGYVPEPHQNWYPGDDYVDWVALSYFRGPETYREAFVKFANVKGKPLMIAEACPFLVPITFGLKSWKQWFLHSFSFIEEPDVKAFC
ncbi:hypothetical protein BVX98_01535, partial [bacterium F11]